jgi:hypothetical protein
MKPGDLVTPYYVEGNAYFRLWNNHGHSQLHTVDKFFMDEVGIVLKTVVRNEDDKTFVYVLSPQGIPGWISETNLTLVSIQKP